MNKPCEVGFLCPFKNYGDEGDCICTYPILPPFIDGELFGLIDEVECSMIDYDSELYNWLLVKDEENVQNVIDNEVKKKDEEFRRMWSSRLEKNHEQEKKVDRDDPY